MIFHTNIMKLQLLNFVRVVVVQSPFHVPFFVTAWTATCQASLSITNSRSSLRLTSIESVMPSNHLILGRPLLLLPPIPPSVKVFSNESALHMRWPKYCSNNIPTAFLPPIFVLHIYPSQGSPNNRSKIGI